MIENRACGKNGTMDPQGLESTLVNTVPAWCLEISELSMHALRVQGLRVSFQYLRAGSASLTNFPF